MRAFGQQVLREDGELEIQFTVNGDRDVVAFFFYRVCFGLGHSYAAANWRSPVGRYELPTEAELQHVKSISVGSGSREAQYYLAVHVQPPAMILGSVSKHRRASLDTDEHPESTPALKQNS